MCDTDVESYVYVYMPGTQITLVLYGVWALLLEGSNPKIEDKEVPGACIYVYHKYVYILF